MRARSLTKLNYTLFYIRMETNAKNFYSQETRDKPGTLFKNEYI